MKIMHNFNPLVVLTVFILLLSSQLYSQQDTVLVEWETAPGSNLVQVNALYDAIAENPDRVFKLQWGGFYHNADPIENEEGQPLVIIGETFEESQYPGKEESWGPAIIQRFQDNEGNAPGQMFNAYGDLTLINVWLMGQTTGGVRSAYEPIKLLGNGKRYIFDRVIFDRNDWHHLGPDAADTKVYVTNCSFRNLFGPTQQWEGLGIRFEVGADTAVFENNTFLNIGFTPFQSEAAPINYFRVNHNTFVNIGRSFSAGSLWRTIYVTNNLFINAWWHGEDESQYSDPARTDPYSGFFQIATIDPSYGLNEGREILVTKNVYWRDPRFQTFYDNYSPVIRAQPFINDTTQGWLDAYPNSMKVMDNYIDVDPDLAIYPLDQEGFFDSMTAHISYYYEGSGTNAPRYYWDPGRDESTTGFINSIWPLPEDFSYSNTELQTAGTDGLPLGDLNWFPDAKSSFEANKDSYVEQIENIIVTPVISVDSVYEAELGTLDGEAEIKEFEGFSYVAFEGAGSVLWNFNMESAATVDLVVYTRSNDATRGQHIRVNGTGIRNDAGYGEYYWNNNLTTEFQAFHVTQASLIEETQAALDLTAGENTIEIAPSWGYQDFVGIDVVVGTDTLHQLRIPNAVQPVNAPVVAEGSDYVPSSFQEVTLGAGGSITINVNASEAGEYLLQIFHATDGSASVQIEVDDQVVFESVTLTDTGDVITDRFNLATGEHSIKISSAAGGTNLDYIQFMSYRTPTGITERPELPNGFALDQNYPNPFNPTTNINFSIGKPAHVKLIVYDILGRKVATLINSEMNTGSYTYQFNASNLASGVYFYSIEAGDFKLNKKMLLLK